MLFQEVFRDERVLVLEDFSAMVGEMSKPVAVVIPAYNEERFIEDVVRRALEHADQVIVVDDGSTDNTGELAGKAGARILKHEVNLGKWAALRDGFSLVMEGFEIVVQLDGDGQHNPGEIPRFLRALKSADLAVGVRSREAMPFIRILSNTITTALLRFLFSITVWDSQCGYRAYRKDALAKLGRFKASRFEGESESLILAKGLGLRIASVPVSTIYDRQKSKVKALRDTYRFLRTILGLKFPRLVRGI